MNRRIFVVLDVDDVPDPARYQGRQEWLSEMSTWIETVESRFAAATVYASMDDLKSDQREEAGAFGYGYPTIDG